MSAPRIRIFVVESPDPLDALQGRSEGPIIEAVARLLNCDVMRFLVKCREDMRSACRYLGSLHSSRDIYNSSAIPLCLHISAHGSADGISFGKDRISWTDLLKDVRLFFGNSLRYPGCRLLIISSCNAHKQCLTQAIEEKHKAGGLLEPPRYVFVPVGNIAWDDAAVAWALFYRLIAEVNLEDKAMVKIVLNKLGATIASFKYFRWDTKACRYISFASRPQK